MNYPKMYRIRQIFEVPKVDNIEETLRHELESIQIHSRIKAGARIAITAGSRGIANINRILKHLVHILKENSEGLPTKGLLGNFHSEKLEKTRY